jgi:hypothetical protein
MRARVRAYSNTGATLLGTLPTIGLTFSAEVGGGGACSFKALATDLDSLACRDSVIKVELETAPATWTAVAAYTLRPPFKRDRVGKVEVDCTATAILEQWASEAVIFPEYAASTMPQGAGTDRAIGWESTAYNPSTDPAEAWTGCYETSRTTMPSQSAETTAAWPTGTNAKWISITGASDQSERKLFRTAQAHPLSIATAQPVRIFIASDSPGTLYVAGEPVLDVSGGEPGKEPIIFQQRDLYLEAGDYACAYDTESVWDTGGDGVDPVIIAMCSLDADGDPDTWLLVSNATKWVACRRDADPPDNDPPGPTPGQTIAMLVDEAQDRGVSGWAGVTTDFTATTDSQGAVWAKPVIERLVRYGSDTLWSVFQMLAETDEADTWMTPALVLRAANAQGTNRTGSVTLDAADIVTMSDTEQSDEGTYAMALGLDGWTDSAVGSPRREYAMEVGTAITRAVAKRIVDSALGENGRWDGSCRLAPGAPTPLVDFFPGDRIAVSYQDAPTAVTVLSMSAQAGEGGLLWDLELAEVTT